MDEDAVCVLPVSTGVRDLLPQRTQDRGFNPIRTRRPVSDEPLVAVIEGVSNHNLWGIPTRKPDAPKRAFLSEGTVMTQRPLLMGRPTTY
jgi:hypothetical protein